MRSKCPKLVRKGHHNMTFELGHLTSPVRKRLDYDVINTPSKKKNCLRCVDRKKAIQIYNTDTSYTNTINDFFTIVKTPTEILFLERQNHQIYCTDVL